MKQLRLRRILLKSLRETINVHGPITKKLIGSATKRMINQVEAAINSKQKK